jgi:hypothetical protein
MTSGEPPPGPIRRGLRTGRLEAFSDGVFAIAITLVLLLAGLFLPVVAVIGYLAIALYYIIPFQRGGLPFRRRRRQPPSLTPWPNGCHVVAAVGGREPGQAG